MTKYTSVIFCLTLSIFTFSCFATSLPPSSKTTDKKNVVIVGGGAAGIFTAYELNKQYPSQYNITIYEANPIIGGHVSEHRVVYGGQTYLLDTGAQFFSNKAQPDYTKLIHDLGLDNEVVNYPSGITIWEKSTHKHLFWIPSTVSGFEKYTPEDWENIVKFSEFIADAIPLNYDANPNWSLSVNDWLAKSHLDDNFKQNIIKNFLYQFVLLPYDRIGDSSAVFSTTYFLHDVFGGKMKFADKAHRQADVPVFQVSQSKIGLYGILQKALHASGARIQLNSPVSAITKDNTGLLVTVNGKNIPADYVVMATQPTAAVKILSAYKSDPGLVSLLQSITGQYIKLPISIQTNSACWMPSNSNYWEAANTIVDTPNKTIQFSAWFGPLRPPYDGNKQIPVFKSWGAPNIEPTNCASTLFSLSHTVLLASTTFINLRNQLTNYQGHNNIFFAGGWTTWYDTQESALLSAMNVVKRLTGDKTALLKQPTTNVNLQINNIASWISMVGSYAPEAYQKQLDTISLRIKQHNKLKKSYMNT